MELYVYALVVVAILLVFKRFCMSGRSSKLPTVLLLGPKESGKTCLLTLVGVIQLQGEPLPTTVQSLHSNTFVLPLPSGPMRLVDIPGHQLTLKKTLEQAAETKAIIFMVDASDKESFRAAADGLYPLLAGKSAPRILVFCNKQDKPGAKKVIMVESELSTAM